LVINYFIMKFILGLETPLALKQHASTHIAITYFSAIKA
jgi:hypothetical protein